jgi:hypothetical protein
VRVEPPPDDVLEELPGPGLLEETVVLQSPADQGSPAH